MEKILIALGGNALGNDPQDQLEKVKKTALAVVDTIEAGARPIICHGNGPQVGMIKKVSEVATGTDYSIPAFPFPECGAMSQGYIGYHLQQAIENELGKRNIEKTCVSLLTQVLVDKNDPAFQKPTKPIGEFMTEERAKELERLGKVVKEDAGRGYRQVVASPYPIDVIEKEAVKTLYDSGFLVIAGGGGGIPVIEGEKGLEGVDAVIDKDLTSVKLAQIVGTDRLIILTAVDKVSINFGKENQKDLDEINLAQLDVYIESGEFGEGSMLPKIKAAREFVTSGEGRTCVIASLEKAGEAVRGEAGTVISL